MVDRHLSCALDATVPAPSSLLTGRGDTADLWGRLAQFHRELPVQGWAEQTEAHRRRLKEIAKEVS